MLSITDRLAIQDLYGRYCALRDTGDIEGWSRCFTEDARLSAQEEVQGRAAIAEIGRQRIAGAATNPWMNGQHWNNNLIVEGDGQTARALCYLMYMGKRKATGEFGITLQGMYEDELVKLDGQWLFRSRKIHLDTPPASIIP